MGDEKFTRSRNFVTVVHVFYFATSMISMVVAQQNGDGMDRPAEQFCGKSKRKLTA
jgi:hypothetical protein